jgi:retron-type reverse transcriptase/predicted regulator of amino acid metabolism with ACT domain
MKPKLTMEMVAQQAGVSITTVSHVINKTRHVNQETKDAVLRVMKDLNYHSPKMAKPDTVNGTCIGVILADAREDYYVAMIKAVETVAADYGVSIIFSDSEADFEKEKKNVDIMLDGRVNGLLLAPVDADRMPKALSKTPIPVVLIDRQYESHNFLVVGINNFRSSFLGAKALIEKGSNDLSLLLELCESIEGGWYKAQPVRRVEIPKADGGVRLLGVPTVIDRMVRKLCFRKQAVVQVLQPVFEPEFSDSSYGFRPGRSAQQAIERAKGYYEEGYTQVVDLDLEKFFDTVNHDLLIKMVRETVKDEAIITLIKKFIKSGVMADGLVSQNEQGTPQGGPLSPLLSNIYLTKFDRMLEERGYKFVRTKVRGMRMIVTSTSGAAAPPGG